MKAETVFGFMIAVVVCCLVTEHPADEALAWLLSNPAVTAPIIGPRTLEQLEEDVHALDVKLLEETLKEIKNIWPVPGGQASETYAW